MGSGSAAVIQEYMPSVSLFNPDEVLAYAEYIGFTPIESHILRIRSPLPSCEPPTLSISFQELKDFIVEEQNSQGCIHRHVSWYHDPSLSGLVSPALLSLVSKEAYAHDTFRIFLIQFGLSEIFQLYFQWLIHGLYRLMKFTPMRVTDTNLTLDAGP